MVWYILYLLMKIIVIKEDSRAEIEIFLNFLHNKEYPQHRNMIFSHFPDLKNLIEQNPENEGRTVEDFIQETRLRNKENIERSTQYIESVVQNKGEKSLQTLVNLMNYDLEQNTENYILIPTIFPMSPFNGNTFFYSIYKSLHGVTEYPKVLAVAMHEISHMMLFNILKKKDVSLDNYTVYFIKELIAPILVYQDGFDGIFKKEIVGNYNVLEIYLEENGKTIKAFDYFLEKFNENKNKGLTFDEFLNDMISICLKIKEPIKEKRLFDNKHGLQIFKNPELLRQFRTPILIG